MSEVNINPEKWRMWSHTRLLVRVLVSLFSLSKGGDTRQRLVVSLVVVVYVIEIHKCFKNVRLEESSSVLSSQVFLNVFLTCSRRDSRPPSHTDAVTVTTTDLGAPRHLVTDAAAHPDGLCFNSPSLYREVKNVFFSDVRRQNCIALFVRL